MRGNDGRHHLELTKTEGRGVIIREEDTSGCAAVGTRSYEGKNASGQELSEATVRNGSSCSVC